MYRIRFHGRGGQGIKTASRILGSAFFASGYEVQDAPVYGAERRGAPIFATVRAAIEPVFERGVIRRPDLVLVADPSLLQVPAAGVLQGVCADTVLLLASAEDAAVWRERLNLTGPILPLGAESVMAASGAFLGAACAGAAARLVGVISREHLEAAIRSELQEMESGVLEKNLEIALGAYDEMAEHEGRVVPLATGPLRDESPPRWIDLTCDAPSVAAPMIRGGKTSAGVETGLWRTQRPIVEEEHCRRCTWICSTLCPDGAIGRGDDGEPVIDYDHCKGCLICVAVCPSHAIRVEPEPSLAAVQSSESETRERSA